MAIDYKDTLAMPKTAFEMRGNLGMREPLFQRNGMIWIFTKKF